MPAQKTSHNMPILIDEKFFLKAKQASNKEEFHNALRSLITRANKIYNNVFESDRFKHVESFPLCKKNYTEIQTIIKNSKFPINFFKVYHLEAELACIQSDFNALNYNVTSEKDLNSLIKNLKKVELNFQKFKNDFDDPNFRKNINLETNDVYEKLLIYRNDFSSSWKRNSNRLLGDTYFNFAKYLEQISLKLAEDYLKGAANFYNKAGLSNFKDQTIQQIKKLEITPKEFPDDSSHNKNPEENLSNLTIVLTRLSPSRETKTNGIKTESQWIKSNKETTKKLPEIVGQPKIPEIVCEKTTESHKLSQIQASKRKNSTDTTFSIPAKKSKGNKQIDCKKLLDELKQIEIENYKLKDPSNNNELIRYKASLAGKDALDRIEKLSFSIKNLSETEKLYCLKEAQNSFSHSIKFYSQAELVKESEKIIEYYDTLTLVINSLELKVSANKPSTEKLILSSNKKLSKKFNNEHSHQPARYTRTFFRELSCPENDVIPIVDNQSNLNNPTLLF